MESRLRIGSASSCLPSDLHARLLGRKAKAVIGIGLQGGIPRTFWKASSYQQDYEQGHDISISGRAQPRNDDAAAGWFIAHRSYG